MRASARRLSSPSLCRKTRGRGSGCPWASRFVFGCAALCLLLLLPPFAGRAATVEEAWVAFDAPQGWEARRSEDKDYPLLWVEIVNTDVQPGARIFVRATCHVSQGVFSGSVAGFLQVMRHEMEAAERRAAMGGVARKREDVRMAERPWNGHPGAVVSYRSSGSPFASGVGYTHTTFYACRPDPQKRRDAARDIWVTVIEGESASEADKALVRDVILPSFRLKRLEASGK